MQEVTGTVLKVEGRQSKNGQHTMYDVYLSDGNKYTTFDAQMANSAHGLVGQQVSAHVTVKQNGKWTNYDLDAIGPSGTLEPIAPGVGTPVQVAAGTVGPNGNATPSIPMAAPKSGGGFSDEDKRRVTKLAAFGTAFNFVGQFFQGAGPEAIEQATELATGIARTLFEQAFDAPQEPVVQPETPQEVAATVPGVQVGAGDATTPATAKAGVQW